MKAVSPKTLRVTVLVGEREKCLSGFLCRQREVDVFAVEGSLVGPAEQEQRLCEANGSGVDDSEAVDKLVGVSVRILTSHIEKCLRDRQWRAQFVRSVGREPLLLGNMCFEPGQHRVERVRQLTELIPWARELNSV